jgi:hypothetical protein
VNIQKSKYSFSGPAEFRSWLKTHLILSLESIMTNKNLLLTLTSISLSVGAIGTSLPAHAQGVNAPTACKAVLSVIPPEISYREHQSHSLPNGEFVKTSAAREALIKSTIPSMENFILHFRGEYGEGDIPWLRFFPEEGTQVQYLSESHGLNHVVTRIVVKGKEPKLRGTLLLPVSGHSNDKGVNARRWAKTDKYNVNIVTHRESQRSSGPYTFDPRNYGTPLLDHAPSLDLVTIQEIEIPLNPDPKGSVTVLYWRHGSAGVEGYVEGRLIEIFFDPTL